jgi:hypothetical protein
LRCDVLSVMQLTRLVTMVTMSRMRCHHSVDIGAANMYR